MLKQLLQEYSDGVRIIFGTLLIIGLVVLLLASNGPAYDSFKTMVTSFFTKAGTAAGLIIRL